MENQPINSIDQLNELAIEQPEDVQISETPATPVTPEQETADVIETSQQPVEESTEIPSFEPNYKYKVYDEEHEIDEFIRDAIKDDETNAKVKELYEKAHGLPLIKDKLERTRTELSDYQNKYTTATKQSEQRWNNLQNLAKTDFETALEELNVPKDNVINTVAKWLEMEQDPAKRVEYENTRQQNRTAYQTQVQHQQVQQNYNELLLEKAKNDVLSVTSSDSIRPVKEYIDNTLGAGTFEREVWTNAKTVFETTGRDLNTQEAVNAIYDKYKAFYTPVQQVQQPVQPMQQPAQTLTQQPTRPVPTIRGTAQSPTTKKIMSIEDLEAEANKANRL